MAPGVKSANPASNTPAKPKPGSIPPGALIHVLSKGQGDTQMAFAATASTAEPRSWSEGPWKFQIMTWTAVSGDTSGTATANRLTTVQHVFIDGGLALTAAPTFSGNVITLAFADPAANAFGTLIAMGK